MVREKQAFLRNLIRFMDAALIGLAFVISYFISFYLREAYHLGEMAYAISPDFEGLLYFTRKNVALVGFYLVGWITALTFVGAYKDLRTQTLASSILHVGSSGVFALLTVGTPIFLFKWCSPVVCLLPRCGL